MAIFRDYVDMGNDRSAEDRRRHKQLIEESIKKNIGNIIAEESIIGQKKDKKIKIPIKSIREFMFIHGTNGSGVGSGEGNEKRGDKIGEEKTGQKENGTGQAGNQEGEDVFETEITIDELIKYLFDDIDLPDMDRRKLADIENTAAIKNSGFQRKGIPPRLAKKRSVVEKIKRKQGYSRSYKEIDENKEEIDEYMEESLKREEELGNRFPFMESDLRYRRIKEHNKKEYNAVVICIMDVSGSMDQTKKYMARSFYFLLYQFIRLKYQNVQVVFVSHTTIAKEVTEKEFFHRGESGGTYISSGYEKALEIIEQRFNPESWNIYAFHCSDGDNWAEDNKRAIEYAGKLCEVCNLFGYGEIIPGNYQPTSTIKNELLKSIKNENFSIVTMAKKEDIVPGLKKLLLKEGE